MRHRIAFSSAFVCALTACDDPASPAGSSATEPGSLKRAGAQTQVAATAQLLVTGLEELQGSAVGLGGALFVTAPLTGSIWRVDPTTGALTLFATGLPARVPVLEFIGSGVVDVAFIGGTAYALVTGVGPDLGGDDIVGIYRVDGPNSFTVIADIGAWSIANPPATDFMAPSGYQFAIEPFRGGFLVTDGHHNRVLRVTLDGEITELIAFGDVVPTGLAVWGNSIYLAQAGPIPHVPAQGQGSRVRTGVADRHRSRGRSQAGRRRGVRPRAHALRPRAGLLGRPVRGDSGAAEHRRSHAGQRGRQPNDRRRRAGSADLGRDHREHRLRRYARR
jgi:hypothetical protein